MIHRSKIDAWLAIVLVCAAAGMVAAGIIPAVVQHDLRSLIPLAAVLALALTVMWPLYYEITDSELIVCSGLVRWRIPLSSIVHVRPSNSVLSSPALSFDRLEVAYEKHGALKKILISPQDKAFQLDLRTRVPQLHATPTDLPGRASTCPSDLC